MTIHLQCVLCHITSSAAVAGTSSVYKTGWMSSERNLEYSKNGWEIDREKNHGKRGRWWLVGGKKEKRKKNFISLEEKAHREERRSWYKSGKSGKKGFVKWETSIQQPKAMMPSCMEKRVGCNGFSLKLTLASWWNEEEYLPLLLWTVCIYKAAVPL